LERAVNVRNRQSKVIKFGFDTSEDAVTWTVFTYLSAHPSALRSAWAGLTAKGQVPSGDDIALLLWGVPVREQQAGTATADRLSQISDRLGENPISRSEPDVIMDAGEHGVVVVEVKYLSGNERSTHSGPFARYVGEGFFAEPGHVVSSGLYELTRNWRIGCELAGTRPFTLVNLVIPSRVLRDSKAFHEFRSGLGTMDQREFRVVDWAEFVRSWIAGAPRWFKDYLDSRFARVHPQWDSLDQSPGLGTSGAVNQGSSSSQPR
jgi:hypothetical protein